MIDAVKFVCSNVGIIGGISLGMHILSSVVYTAKNGSAYPDECIEDPNNKYIALAEDFLDFVPDICLIAILQKEAGLVVW
ncbi:MAG: hypothetical protein IPH57_00130 [Saprospiraceae bacterium]|nr:hypothetical protein [Saprospiraceae bacterium]